MSDFFFLALLTILAAITSFLIFGLTVKQVNSQANYGIKDAFNEVNEIVRQLEVRWKQNRMAAVLMGVFTFIYYYMRTKSRNSFGRLDVGIVVALSTVLIAMTTIGIPDIILEIILWLKTNVLSKKD